VALGSVGVPTGIVICKETSGKEREKRISANVSIGEGFFPLLDVIPIIPHADSALDLMNGPRLKSYRRVIRFNDVIIFPRFSHFKFERLGDNSRIHLNLGALFSARLARLSSHL
jgi:hypothetical protein